MSSVKRRSVAGSFRPEIRDGLFPMPLCPVCSSHGVIVGTRPELSVTFYDVRCRGCGYRYRFFRRKRSLTLDMKNGCGRQ